MRGIDPARRIRSMESLALAHPSAPTSAMHLGHSVVRLVAPRPVVPSKESPQMKYQIESSASAQFEMHSDSWSSDSWPLRRHTITHGSLSSQRTPVAWFAQNSAVGVKLLS